MTRILFVGQKPETVDFSDPLLPPGFDADKINAGIAVAMDKIAERGWQGDTCMITPDEAGQAVTIRRRPPMVQCGSVDERLGTCGSALMAFDQVNQRLDPKVGKRHDAVVPCTLDPDQSVLLVHFDGDVP